MRRGIDVMARDGVVTLQGTVPSFRQKWLAERAARHLPPGSEWWPTIWRWPGPRRWRPTPSLRTPSQTQSKGVMWFRPAA